VPRLRGKEEGAAGLAESCILGRVCELVVVREPLKERTMEGKGRKRGGRGKERDEDGNERNQGKSWNGRSTETKKGTRLPK